MKKRIMSALLAIGMVFTLLPTAAWADQPGGVAEIAASAEFVGSGGSGTEDEPYLISNLDDLEKFRDYINADADGGKGEYFKLTANIDMSEKYAGGNSWTPIGTSSTGFNGEFDGAGHTIKVSLLYTDNTVTYVGLFGTTGSIIGDGGAISNLGVSGSINSTADVTAIGGIVGQNSGNCRIESCYSSVNITGKGSIGGIVGMNSYGSIINSYNTGNITNSSTDSSDGTGGIVGKNHQAIMSCYNVGNITLAVGGAAAVGCIAGTGGYGTVSICYYLTGTAEKGIGDEEGTVEKVEKKNAEGFKTLASTLNDGLKVWYDCAALGRPLLTANAEFAGTGGGMGTEGDPYKIANLTDLEAFCEYINTDANGGSGEYFEQTAKIDMSSKYSASGTSWTPIGTFGKPFNGTFDGGNFTISGIYINTTDDYQGLFGFSTGTIKNLTVSGSVTGKNDVGGIVGYNNGGSVENCCNTNAVNGSYAVGGIAGYNEGGSIENCCNAGAIKGSSSSYSRIGGIAGSNSGSVKNCYNTGTVSSNTNTSIGGIAGYNSGGSIENCYYLDTCGAKGEGTSKTEDAFNSGEVAWLLQNKQEPQAWGQKLSDEADDYPVLTSEESKKVLKVTFATQENEAYDAKYTNPNGTVEMPETPVKDNYTFEKWAKTQNADGEKFDEETPVTEDMTVYAVGRDHFGGDSADITLSETYGYKAPLTVNLDEHMKYANEDVEAAGKFTYAISDKGNTNASIENENTLSVPTGLNANDYTITVTATEKTPQYSLMSVDSYGTEAVTLTVKVTIAKAPATVTPPTAKAPLTYTGTAQELIDAGSVESVSSVSGCGEMQYSLDEAGDYSTDVPTGKDVGSYTVYWKIDGADTDNYTYTNGTSGTVNVTIGQSDADITPTQGTITYDYGNESGITLEVTVAPNKAAAAGIALTSAEANQVEFVFPKGGKTEIVDNIPAEGGKATVTISADQVKNYFNAGSDNTVTVNYGGGDNLKQGTTKITVTVNPKPLTFTFTPEPRDYEAGNTTITGKLNETDETGKVTTGLVGTDTVTANYSAEMNDADAGTDKEVTVVVTLAGDDADYYKATNPAGVTVNISKADITEFSAPTGKELKYTGVAQELITAGTATGGTMKYYLGTTNPGTTADSWTEDASTIKGTDAKEYTIWYYVKGDDNHNDTIPQSVTATISKETPSYTAPTAKTGLVYTGEAQQLVDAGDTKDGTIQYSLSEAGVYQDDVPTGTDAKTYEVWYKVTGDGNHADVGPTKVGTVEISKAESTVTVGEVDSATYGSNFTLTAKVTSGSITADKFSGATVQFKVGGENFGAAVNVDASGKATLTIEANDQEKQHTLFGENGTVSVTAAYSGNNNITEKTSDATEVKVSQKTLTFTFNASNKTYDGNENVSGNFADFSSQLVSGDAVEVDSFTAKANDANVGKNKPVTVTVSSLKGKDAKYYTPGEATSNSIEIAKAESSMSEPTGESGLVYNGGNQKLIETVGSATGGTMKYYVGEKGVATQPGADVVWQDSDAITGKDAGTYTVWYKVVGDDNHNDTDPDSITVQIEQKEVTLTWTGHESLTYTGSAHTITATVNNKESGDEVNVTVEVKANGGETGATGATATNAGSYTAEATQLTGSAAGNYKLPDDNPTQDFTIKKAPVSFEVTDYTVTYDTKAHTATVKQTDSETPKLSEDDFSVTYGTEGAADKTANKTNVGTYDIYVTLKNDNFKFKDEADETRELKLDDKLTIKQAELTLSVTGSAITYGQTLSASELTGTAKISDGTEITGTWAWDTTDAAKYPSVSKDSENTEYTVKFTPTSSDASNFTSESLSKTITITVNKAKLTPSIDTVQNIDQFSGETETTGTIKLTGAVRDENPTATGTFNFDTPTAGENKTVTVTGITLTGDWGANYELTTTELSKQNTTASIGKRVVMLEWKLDGENAFEITYDGNSHTVTATVTNPVEKYPCTVTVTDGDKTDANTYTATAALSDDANYTLPEVKTQTYTIKKATVSVDNITMELTYTTQPQTVGDVTVKTGGAPALTQGSDYSVTYRANSDERGTTDANPSETNVGTYGVWVELTSDNAKNNYEFEGKQGKVKVGTMTIEQATLELTVTGSAITYGDTLNESNLTGTATIAGDGGATIPGTWAWEIQVDTYPKPSDKSHDYVAVFTPSETYAGNFETSTLKTTVTITVNPYQLTPQVDSVDSKTYDGNVNAQNGTLKFAENLDIVPFKDNKPTATGTFTFTDKNVGENKHVNVSGITLNNSTDYALKESSISDAATTAKITAKEVTLTWDGYTDLVYSGEPVSVTATTTDFVAADTENSSVRLTFSGNAETDAGTYTAKASLAGADATNYTLTDDSQEYTIAPATVSFTIGAEAKVDWSTRGETNDDPNLGGYTLTGSGTDFALTMTYDSYNHKANVSQTTGEPVAINAAASNGYKVTYRKGSTDVNEVRNAGTYDIIVTFTPTADGIYNYAFSDQETATRELKIGTIEIKPYEVTVIWTHLSYVYHAHPMHPDIRVQDPFENDNKQLPPGQGLPSDFNIDNPESYSGAYLVAFAATDDSDVKEYTVTAGLYGQNAGNYTVKNPTATVSIVPAPVTFTVSNNVWDLTDESHPTEVKLTPVWGVVSTTPDKDEGTDHQYPDPGTAVVSELDTTIVYKKNGEEVTPTDAGTYEVWVAIGNTNFRHSATSDGAFHKVGELVLTNNLASVKTYKVTFDAGYEGGAAPEAMENLLEGQMVILPAGLTRDGYLFQGWSFGGITYRPNEEFPMPASDVTFKAEWLDVKETRTVGGTVKQEVEGNEPKSLLGATVTLKQGDNEAGEAITDADGNFSFKNLVPGIYNLEVRYFNGSSTVVKTFLVDVEKDNLTGDYILPDGALNTVVEADVTAVVDMEEIVETPSATADEGIYTTDDEETVKNGGSVEFKMTVKGTELNSTQEEQVPVPEDRIGLVVDLELTKTVTGSSSDGTTEIHDSKQLITTVIHLPAEIQGKSSYTVYRFHDTDGDGSADMQTITTSANRDGEYLRVIRDGTAIEIHAKFYSTYVLTWTQSTGVYYTVKLPERVENGSVTVNHRNALRGSTVTLTVTPEEGYALGELTVTDKDGKEVALTDNGDGTYTFKMPYGGVTVKAVFKCLGGENCPGRKFADLDVNAWYHEYTDYVLAHDLMHGISVDRFLPEDTVTRAQMVMVLWNMSGSPVVNYYMTYSDVSEGAWYAEAIRWAASEEIAGGYGNNRFGPDDPITREQMAAMLYRYEQEYGQGGFTGDWMYRLPFTDLDKMSDWAIEAVAWCNMNGVIKGRDSGVFDPRGYARRNEMAAVLMRYCQLEPEEK